MKRDDQITTPLARESVNPIIRRQLVTFYDEEMLAQIINGNSALFDTKYIPTIFIYSNF